MKISAKRCSFRKRSIVGENTENPVKGVIFGNEIENYDELVENGTVEQIFDKDWVKDAASKVNKFIEKMMYSYLGIK